MTPKLHVYAQKAWHTDVTIIGDREALELLRDLCTTALEKMAAADEFTTNDGEGYDLRISRVDDEPLWNTFATPYTDDDAADNREDVVRP